MNHCVVVGLGSIGRRHAENLLGLGFRVTAVRTKKQMDGPQQEFLEKHRIEVSYDLDETLQKKPFAVIVANPTSLHAKTALRALRAGAHVFIEKPISHSLSGLSTLSSLAKKKRLILYVGYHFRMHPQLQALKRMIDKGAFGKISFARFTNGEYLPGWHPWEDFRKSYASKQDLGGGVSLTQSHDIDTALWLFGAPTSVRAHSRRTGTLGIDVDDMADFSLSTPRAEEVSIHLDYLTRPPVKQLEIYGEKGSVVWDYHTSSLSITDIRGKTKTSTLKTFMRNDLYIAELKDFFKSIKNNKEPDTSIASATEVLRIARIAITHSL